MWVCDNLKMEGIQNPCSAEVGTLAEQGFHALNAYLNF
jgi:hypothetical protein